MTPLAASAPLLPVDSTLEEFHDRSLLVYDDKVYVRDAHGFSCDEAHALFEIGMGRFFRTVTLCSRVRREPGRGCYAVDRPNVGVCPLPDYSTVPALMARTATLAPAIRRVLLEQLDRHDYVWLAWPHPVSLLALALTARRRTRAVPFLVVRENMPEMVRRRYRGVARAAALVAVRGLLWQLSRWAPRPLVFAVGDEMVAAYRTRFDDVFPIAFPYFSEDADPGASRRRAPGAPLTLLYVGRLEPEKGLPVLLESVEALAREGRRLRLDVVGAGRDAASSRERARRLGLDDVVTFHGYVPFGEPLFERYRAADAVVIPSLSEAVPSVLLEASAFGLPFVASRVGGIPAVAAETGGGMLVEPGSADDLARALRALDDGCSPPMQPARGMPTMEAAQRFMLGALWRYERGLPPREVWQ